MKFFILGDSWGVGEWTASRASAAPSSIFKAGPDTVFKAGPDTIFKAVPDTGLDHWLRALGHSVTNISAASAGNFGQLRHAYWTLDQHSDYDYIVWFYTEDIRDIAEIAINDPDETAIQYPDLAIADLDQDLQYIQEQNCKYAQYLYDRYHLPFIVIGGQGTVPNTIKNYSFAHWVIESWLKELLELNYLPPKIPFVNSWSRLERVLQHYGIDSKKYILEHIDELDRISEITQLATRSKLFPDNTHPGAKCYQVLATRILQIVA